MKSLDFQNFDSKFLLFQTADGRTRIDVQFKGETVWLSLNQMSELFQRDKSVISKHIHNIFNERELTPEATVANFATVQTEGSRQLSKVEKDFLSEVKRLDRLARSKKSKSISQKEK